MKFRSSTRLLRTHLSTTALVAILLSGWFTAPGPSLAAGGETAEMPRPVIQGSPFGGEETLLVPPSHKLGTISAPTSREFRTTPRTRMRPKPR